MSSFGVECVVQPDDNSSPHPRCCHLLDRHAVTGHVAFDKFDIMLISVLESNILRCGCYSIHGTVFCVRLRPSLVLEVVH